MKALGTRPGYDGVSGSVVLDASGDRLGTYDVFNLQLSTARRARERRERRQLAIPLSTSSASYELVGTWEPGSAVQLTVSPFFPGGTIEVPRDTVQTAANIAALLVPLVARGAGVCFPRGLSVAPEAEPPGVRALLVAQGGTSRRSFGT